MTASKTCRWCKWWDANFYGIRTNPDFHGPFSCVRHAPSSYGNIRCQFPSTFDHYTCGDFQKVTKPTQRKKRRNRKTKVIT
jgi:hypothetical protein